MSPACEKLLNSKGTELQAALDMDLIWAKTGDDGTWHPLVLHCLDVAAVAQALLEREPDATRHGVARALGLPWTQARPWLLLLIAAHDLGKASPGFQCKWRNLTALPTPRSPDTSVKVRTSGLPASQRETSRVIWARL
jgi:hypothetical protein